MFTQPALPSISCFKRKKVKSVPGTIHLYCHLPLGEGPPKNSTLGHSNDLKCTPPIDVMLANPNEQMNYSFTVNR